MRPASVVALCLLTGALGWGAQPGNLARLAPQAAAERAATAQSAAPDALDATPYRDAIAAIEDVLYREAPPTWGDPELVSTRAMTLGERLYADLGPPRGPRALTDLVDFATAVAAQADSGFAAPELDAPRAAWEHLRARWFQPAPWFRTTNALLVATQRPPAPTASLVELHEHWKWAATIETMLDDGRPAIERHGDVEADAADGSREEPEFVGRWRDFARDWDDRVHELGLRTPRPPARDGERNLVFAHQALEQALHQLALATSPDGDAAVPTKSWRTQCLDAAATHVAAAREFLGRARTGASHPQTASAPAAIPTR
jgi:hypothetical protein